MRVAFRQRATIYRAHLRKMIYKDNASYKPSPLCKALPSPPLMQRFCLFEKQVYFVFGHLSPLPTSPHHEWCTQRAGCYGVATVSRIDEIIGLFCRILSLFQGSFAKETYNFIDPTNQRHPIRTHTTTPYGVATISRIDKIIGLFRRI